MKSWEVLRQASDGIGIKALAAKLNLSSALVYKWCQEPPSEEEPEASGARNPLDRVSAIFQATRDPEVINYLCMVADGFFVQNPAIPVRDPQEPMLAATQRMVQDFAGLLGEISASIEDDGVISESEAGRIRACWERLKSQAEQFVVASEQGIYGKPPAPGRPARAG
jgi:hypothetical protein